MEHILLLHGAIGAKDQMEQLTGFLKENYIVHAFNFRGHGGKNFPGNGFSIPDFADDVLAYLQQNKIESANIFGYSMGGYVAMYIAKYHPQFVNKVITLATKFYWDNEVAAKEVKMLQASTILEKLPAFAVQLEQRHSPNDWKLVLEYTKDMLLQLGKNNVLDVEDYKNISTPCLLLLGEKDKMITQEETVAVKKALVNSEFKLLTGMPHPIEQVDPGVIAALIIDFLEN